MLYADYLLWNIFSFLETKFDFVSYSQNISGGNYAKHFSYGTGKYAVEYQEDVSGYLYQYFTDIDYRSNNHLFSL